MTQSVLHPHPVHALVTITALSLAAIIGSLPFQQLLLLIVCRDIGLDGASVQGTNGTSEFPLQSGDYSTCAQLSEVQDQVAKWNLWYGLSSDVPALFTAVLSGYFLDMYGRRIAMLVTCIVALITAISHFYAALFQVPLWLFVVTSALTGLTGGGGLYVMAAAAYIADTSDPVDRTFYFMWKDGCFSLALMIGPTIGGLITKEFGFVSVFGLQTVLLVALIVYLFTLFPDSRVAQENSTVISKKTMAAIFRESAETTFLTLKTLGKFQSAIALVLILIIESGALTGFSVLFLLYPAKLFGWDSLDVATFMFTLSLQRIFWLTLGIPWIMQYARSRGIDKVTSEIWALRFGVCMLTVGELWFGLAQTDFQFRFGTSFRALGVFASPMLKSLLSTLVPPSYQGRLFGCIKIMESIPVLLAGAGINWVYRSTVDTAPNATFFVITGLLLVSSMLSFFYVSYEGVIRMEMGGSCLCDAAAEDVHSTEPPASESTPLMT